MGTILSNHSVRPNVYNVGDDEEMADEEGRIEDEAQVSLRENEEGEKEEKGEEARYIKGKKPVRQPTKEEYDEHMRTHLPFRKWCPHCVKGKRKNDPRRADKEKEKQEIPLMSWDYMEQRGKDGKKMEGTRRL